MDSLSPEYLADLFCLVSNSLKEVPKPKGGRPLKLNPSELVTMLIWGTLVITQKTLKGIFFFFYRYHQSEFPGLKSFTYAAFINQCHRYIDCLVCILNNLLASTAPIRFLDSTLVAVCKNCRANRYKVAIEFTGWGKNHQGYTYGFKLHGACDHQGRLAAVWLTPASVYDGHLTKRLINRSTRIAIGDSHYGGKVQTDPLQRKYGTIFLVKPHHTQTKKIATLWQNFLIDKRATIENVWQKLKEQLHLVTSYPRSFTGYVIHYVRILIAYQLGLG